MKFLFIIFIFQVLLPQNPHRGCMKNQNFRDALSRPDLSETYLSPSGHFMIHYDAPGSDKAPIQTDENPQNGIPDYVEEVGVIADLTRETLVGKMGFREEIPDEDGKYDIYIVNSNNLYDAYGWNYIDNNDAIIGSSWLEIDNDYSEDVYYTHGLEAMRVTVAHEFFHAIQRAYHEKSTGTYIEGGGQSVSYSYFYEFTSMWFEDVMVPEGNDYLYFLSSSGDSRHFFSNPEQKFSETDGYSVALYGHYLSSIIEGLDDQTSSTIIRKAWEKFSDELLDPIDALNSVLSEEYGMSFIESWIDFCSRNFHNGQFPSMNNNIYYYIDQTSAVLDDLGIDNANLHKGYAYLDEEIEYLSQLGEQDLQTFELSNESVEIYSVNSDTLALLTLEYSDFPMLGKYVITELESPVIDNAYIEDLSTEPIKLNSNNSIHFIYATENSEGTILESTSYISYFPPTPELLSVSIIDDGIEIVWSEEQNVTYNIYRNNILIADGVADTVYIDNAIDPVMGYKYQISSTNYTGESELSNSISIITWPEDSDIVKTKIVSIHPNPIYRPGISPFNLIIDYGEDFDNVEIGIYDIMGKEIILEQLGPRKQGRSQEYLGHLLNPALSSGIYFMYIYYDNFVETTLKQKFTILK